MQTFRVLLKPARLRVMNAGYLCIWFPWNDMTIRKPNRTVQPRPDTAERYYHDSSLYRFLSWASSLRRRLQSSSARWTSWACSAGVAGSCISRYASLTPLRANGAGISLHAHMCQFKPLEGGKYKAYGLIHHFQASSLSRTWAVFISLSLRRRICWTV
jgi:hypothetical protein